MKRLTAVLGVVMVIVSVSCGDTEGVEGGSIAGQLTPSAVPAPTSTGAERYVTVGFWNDPSCGGAPVSTNRFPVHYGDSQCYAWPGRSGQNSASRFACGKDSFSYTQWTTLACSGGQNPSGTRKTSTLTDCTQDVPPTLYARIVDLSGCRDAVP